MITPSHPRCPGPLDPRGFTRRQLLQRLGHGLGGIALGHLLRENAVATTLPDSHLSGLPHFAPKVRRVIFLFMSGGPSHLESFDYKPELLRREGGELPASYHPGERLPGMAGTQSLLQLKGSPWPFKQYGNSGAWVSDRFPHLTGVVDDLCFIKSMVSDSVNHDPALTFIQTGSPLAGRPSIGAWVNYGLGSECADLPAFVVMITRRAIDQPLSAKLWDSGFLPSKHQGVQFRAARDPV
jgi:Protein of unknown function (DUF1501)